MPADPLHSPPAAALGLSYDELPAGSVLRREFDGRGGVTITAPAGELPTSQRRAAAVAALVPATVVMFACSAVLGLVLLQLARTNRLDPSLRPAAVVALAALSGGLFLFVWLVRYLAACDALLTARRHASVLHADGRKLLFESARPSTATSVEVAVEQMQSLTVTIAALDDGRRLPRVPCLRLLLRDGSAHLLLGGHHAAELRWVAATLSGVTGVPVLSDANRGWTKRTRFFRADLPFAGRVGG